MGAEEIRETQETTARPATIIMTEVVEMEDVIPKDPISLMFAQAIVGIVFGLAIGFGACIATLRMFS